ncbi:MAG: hypothetical protein ACI90V_010159, partial [Bacillariaceae sp.]
MSSNDNFKLKNGLQTSNKSTTPLQHNNQINK